jgi:hypothetical protein
VEKKRAVQAQILWNWRCESSGMYWCSELSFIFVIRFRHLGRVLKTAFHAYRKVLEPLSLVCKIY